MESITRWCQWELKPFLTRWQDVYITHKAEQTPTEPSGKTLKCSAILRHGMHEEAAEGISGNPSCLRYLGQEAGGVCNGTHWNKRLPGCFLGMLIGFLLAVSISRQAPWIHFHSSLVCNAEKEVSALPIYDTVRLPSQMLPLTLKLSTGISSFLATVAYIQVLWLNNI